MPSLQNFSNQPVSGRAVIEFHESCFKLGAWPKDAAHLKALAEENVWQWVAVNHRNNCLLWDEEDLARRTMATDADITANKRAIDGFNQARNDATERVDEYLLLALGLIDAASMNTTAPKSKVAAGARLSSETAGSMMDRMSIMALKIKAMRAQTERRDVDAAHIDSSKVKLARLEEQRTDLAACVDGLLAESKAGTAYFKVYRQFKMYNDPRFNPVLVAEQAAKAAKAAGGGAGQQQSQQAQ